MKKRHFTASLILLSVSLLAQAGQIEQTRSGVSDVLALQIKLGNSEYSSTRDSFFYSMLSTRVPGGMVSIQNCDREHPRRPTPLSSGTLRETLDTIVKGDLEWSWQIDNGVVNLLPVQDGADLLNVYISKFKVENAQSLDAIVDNLLQLPEVKVAIAKLQLIGGTKIIVQPMSVDPEKRPKYSVECNDMTVREALNAIARINGRAVWEYKEQHCDGKTVYTLDFVIE
jgi:hypothetical protein